MTEENETRPGGRDVYVGPRPFRTGQKLYGRDQESRQLVSLLISHRLVLLHSPSGAGKTSLIHAKVVPALQKRRFEIPMHETAEADAQPVVVRLNRAPEPADPPGANRYALSALLSLEMHRPEAKRRPADELASLTIDQYLEEAFPGASLEVGEETPDGETFRPLLLLLDQFEELLTLDPTDRETKFDFLGQLGAALENEGRWALFSIREDFLGGLEPFLSMIPTGLAATYHLDPLSAEIAVEVITKPAAEAGVAYEEGVVETLVEDLRQVRVQGVGGDFEMKAGPSVEPVHLQVVCQSLWQVKGDAKEIRHEHLEQLSRGKGTGVDQVLAAYYAGRVRHAASEGNVSERRIRDWFGKQLIGAQKVRRPILVNEAVDFGMTPECLDVLDKAFLIRRETRSGAQWYELSHDRLMDPVIADNEAWRTENLSEFQIHAEIWHDRGRPVNLLLKGDSLAEAERAAAADEKSLNDAEREFLQESSEAQQKLLARQERENHLKRIRTMRLGLIAGGTALILLAGLTGFAFHQKVRADKAKTKADWEAYSGLLAEAQNEWDQGYLRLAWEHLGQCERYHKKHLGWEYDYLKTLFAKDQHTLFGHDASVSSVAFSPDGMRLASGSLDESIRIWDLATRRPVRIIRPNESQWIMCVGYSPDGTRLVSGDTGFKAHVWDAESGERILTLSGHTGHIYGVAYSPDGSWIVTASGDKTLKMWDPQTGELIRTLEGNEQRVKWLAVDSDGQWIASCSEIDGSLRYWDPDTGESILEKKAGAPVIGIAAMPPGSIVFATEHAVGQVAVNRALGEIQFPAAKPGEPIEAFTSIGANPKGFWFATGTRRGVINRNWVKFDESLGLPMNFPKRRAHTGAISALAVRPGTPPGQSFVRPWVVASGGVDCLVKINDDAPAFKTPSLEGHTDTVWHADFSPDEKRIASSSWDGTVKLWNQVPSRIDDTDKQFPGRVWEPCRIRLLEIGGVEEIPNESPEAETSVAIIAKIHGNLHFRIFDQGGNRVVDTDESKLTEAAENLGSMKNLLNGLWEGQPIDSLRHQQILDVLTSIVGYWRVLWKEERTLAGHEGLVSFAWDPKGEWLASGGEEATLRITTLDPDQDPKISSGHDKWIFTIDVSPDGNRIATCGGDSDVLLWDANGAEDQKPARLVGHEGVVYSVVFSNDGARLFSSSQDKTIKVWDIASGEALRTVAVDTGDIRALAVSPDGELLASGCNDSTIMLWDTGTLEKIRTLNGHTAWVTCLDFSPDGKRLVSGSQDNTIKLWELETGQDVLTLNKHLDTVWSVRFSPSGSRIISASEDRTIKIWEATAHEFEVGE